MTSPSPTLATATFPVNAKVLPRWLGRDVAKIVPTKECGSPINAEDHLHHAGSPNNTLFIPA